jgi:hypothetical protein
LAPTALKQAVGVPSVGRSKTRSAGQFKALGFLFEPRAESCGVRRVRKAVAHEHGVFILHVHVELADIVVEELSSPRLSRQTVAEATRLDTGTPRRNEKTRANLLCTKAEARFEFIRERAEFASTEELDI